MGRNGFGTVNPPTAIQHQAAAMAGWIGPSHSPWACALECSSPSPHPSPCLLFPFLIDLLIGINHQLSRQAFDRTLSFSLVFLCLDLGRVFLRGNCVKYGPLGSVFIGQNRPPTAWTNRHNLLAEWVQLAPLAPLRPNRL